MYIEFTSILKVILDVSIAFLLLVAAFFFVLEHYQKPESEIVRKWLENKWSKIDVNKWSELPFKALITFLKSREVPILILKFILSIPKYILLFIFLLLVLFLPLFIMDYFKAFLGFELETPYFFDDASIILFVSIVVFFIIIDLLKPVKRMVSKKALTFTEKFYISLYMIFLFLFTIYALINSFALNLTNYRDIIAIIVWGEILSSRILSVFFIILFILSACTILLAYIHILSVVLETSFENRYNYLINFFSILFISFTISIFVTFIAIAIGYTTASSTHEITQPFLLISNFIFDFLTLIFSFWIIKKALQSKSIFAIPTAIAIDLFFAFLFALGSLYFGLLPTESSLSISEVITVFFGGGTADCPTCNRGAYFYLMHTTFLPTLFYLSLILLLWLGKLTIKFSDFLLVPKDNLKRPYGLCRALCLFLAVLLGFFRAAAQLF